MPNCNQVNCNNKECLKVIPTHLQKIFCCTCYKYYHVKCTNLKNTRTFFELQEKNTPWICKSCLPPIITKKVKCGKCCKTVPNNSSDIKCLKCKKYFHGKCAKITNNKYLESNSWICTSCVCNEMPFRAIDNNNLALDLNGLTIDNDNINITPSFTIATLLDKIPGNIIIETDEFLSDSINSKYYSLQDFLSHKNELTKNSLTVFHLNIVSLQGHIDDLKALLAALDHSFDIIAISETKILENIDITTNIDLIGYNFVGTPTKSSYGGTGIFIRSCFDYDVRKDLSRSEQDEAEAIFVEITNLKKKILIGCIYRHHDSIKKFTENFLLSILNLISKENKTCILAGDFNIDLLKCDDVNEVATFYDILSSYGFRPLILQPTRVTMSSATLIDNIFINDLEVTSTGGNITASISDHFPQFCGLDINVTPKINKSNKYGRCYKNFVDDEFKNELMHVDWTSLFNGKNSTQCFESFFKVIEDTLNVMAPIRKLTKKELGLQEKPWITNGILKSIKNRDNIFSNFRREHDVLLKTNLYNDYKRMRNKIKNLIRKSKSDYYNSFFEENKTNIKKTWEGIREIVNISKKSKSSPSRLRHNNSDVSDQVEISNIFNNFFVNIGNKVEEKIPNTDTNYMSYLKNPNNKSIFLTPVDNKEILTMIKNLSSAKACGPNSIPTNILKTHASTLCEPLKNIINLSFCDGLFPDLLKFASVCPIFKGSKEKCENYRPISLLSNLSKLFERAMHTRVYDFLESSNVFYNLQFGFRKKYSTNHALLSIVENIKQSLDNKTFACGVFIDLEKAFDTVNHNIILDKLKYYGIRGPAHQWFSSYLSSRKQKVNVEGVSSNFLDITCGVPQGSILGPLLFLLYINDMNKSVKHSCVYHFADDTNLLYKNKDPKKLRKNINSDLKDIFTWLCANRLSLNVSKTEFIVFKPPKKSLHQRITLKLNGKTLFESTKLKYLGLIMDDRLTWKHHISELRKKLSKSIGIIYKMKKLNSHRRIMLSLYNAIFQSHVNYGLSVWGCANDKYIESIRLSQKRVIRIISNADYTSPTSKLFKDLNVLKIDDLLKIQYASLMWDYDKNILPSSLNFYFKSLKNNHHVTRQVTAAKLSENIIVNTDLYGKTMLKFIGPKVLNFLKDQDFFSKAKTKSFFIKKYKQYLIESYV